VIARGNKQQATFTSFLSPALAEFASMVTCRTEPIDGPDRDLTKSVFLHASAREDNLASGRIILGRRSWFSCRSLAQDWPCSVYAGIVAVAIATALELVNHNPSCPFRLRPSFRPVFFPLYQ